MAKFKVGDWVEAISCYDSVSKGMTGQIRNILSRDYNPRIGVSWDNFSGKGHKLGNKCPRNNGYYIEKEDIKLIKKGDIMTIENAKFALIYELDQDPIEYFKTEKQALKKIEELLEDSAVNRQSIYLVPLSGVRKVKVNNFSLEKV